MDIGIEAEEEEEERRKKKQKVEEMKKWCGGGWYVRIGGMNGSIILHKRYTYKRSPIYMVCFIFWFLRIINPGSSILLCRYIIYTA